MSVRILMYHGLDSRERPSELTAAGDLVYVLPSKRFEEHLVWLAAHGWSVDGPGADATTARATTAKRCVLTFDDGHVTNYQLALPALQRASLHAHFFITTDWIGSPYFMSSSMLRELDDAKMIIGAHGASHRFLTDLSTTDARTELDTSKKRLEDILGHAVTTMSAPGGRIDARIGAMAAELGYTNVYTSDPDAPFAYAQLTVHGRLALKRGYTMKQFEKLMHTGRQPEWAVRTRGIALTKRALGNKRYERLRAAALTILELRHRQD